MYQWNLGEDTVKPVLSHEATSVVGQGPSRRKNLLTHSEEFIMYAPSHRRPLNRRVIVG